MLTIARAAVLSLLAFGCGGRLDDAGSGEGHTPGGGGTAGAGTPSAGTAGSESGGFGQGGIGGAGATGGAGYEDPGCPDIERPEPIHECDPLAPFTGCGLGERCSPVVQYAGDACQSEVFGTLCLVAGPGAQGDDCTREECSDRHVCVTSGEGNQCVQLCEIDPAVDDCPPGLLCQALDVDGFYICF